MTKKVPELIIPKGATKEEALIYSIAHNKAKDLIENYQEEGELDYDDLMSFALEQERELYYEALKLIQNIMYDKNGNIIKEQWTTKRLNNNPDIKEIFETYMPEALQRIEAIELVSDYSQKIDEHVKRWQDTKRIYFIVGALIGFAVFQFIGAAVGLILGYIIWNSLHPGKIAQKKLKQAGILKDKK